MPFGRTVLTTPETSSGQRSWEVTLQAVAQGDGTSGFPVETVTTLATVWASRSETTADEHFTAGQPSAFTATVWQIPYREDMDPETVDVPTTRRVLSKGRAYDIRSASLIGWKRHIELITLARTA